LGVSWRLCHFSHFAQKRRIGKLRDPNKPFRWSEKKRTGKRERYVNYVERIEIYDVHGFFQSSLLKAIENFPGVVTADELELIKEGKKQRGAFVAADLPMLKRYTAAELKALASMMEKLRSGFKFTDPATGEERQLEISNWWGAGAIAQALLKMYLGKKPAHILGDMSKPWLAIDAQTGLERDTFEDDGRYSADALAWVTHARFGGRIELCKQGVSRRPVYLYDVASAYPAICVQLPSMEGGRWIWKANPTRNEIENSNIFSMFKVQTRNFTGDLPFYALSFRTENRSIMFPPNIVGGRYMRDDIIAALNHFDYFNERDQLAHFGIYREGPQLVVSEAMFFVPGDETSRPLSPIRGLFDWRASLPKNDMRGQVIKLGINSIYGKMAQRVGKAGEPPAFGSLWYAAAITAGTRRKLMEAALADPKAVIAFATDAVFATRKLSIHVPERKLLGEWEFEEGNSASAVQSGVYTIHKGSKLKTASRGFTPNEDKMNVGETFADALDRDLFVNVPEIWRNGGDKLEFEDKTYLGLGLSVAYPQAWKDVGSWKTHIRELRLNDMSAKRGVPPGEKARASRADKMIDLYVRPYALNPKLGIKGMLKESAPSIPAWMMTKDNLSIPASVRGKRKRRRANDGYGEADDIANVEAGLKF
jgi:DNA polymerase type B, organellar and viral